MKPHRFARRTARLAAALLLSIAAAGCAIVAKAPPGISEPELVSRYGEPTARHPLPDGSVNYEYSTQPMGQFLWMARVRDGKLASVRQVLTDREFATVEVGVDTRETILAHFGTPAENIHLGGKDREVWSYRYKAEDVFPALMNVQFDRAGVVREIFSGFDPLWGGGRNDGGGGQR